MSDFRRPGIHTYTGVAQSTGADPKAERTLDVRAPGPAAAPAAAPSEAATRAWVITLLSAATPGELDPRSAMPPLAGLTVFRARRDVQGREEHLLQLGYFDSQQAAEAMLIEARRRHPGAVVETAQRASMGSLDDTLRTRFDIERRPTAPVPQTVPAPTPEPEEPVARQFYAVQLIQSSTPIDMTRVRRLAIFEGYSLYRTQSDRDGRRSFGLRLGFFTDQLSAKLVMQYVRSEFERAAVVPVSEREAGRVATTSARQRSN